jgi:predicted metallopeptidase
MSAEKKERYEDSEDLRQLANEILGAVPYFPANDVRFAIIYTNAKMHHIAGMCSKVAGPVSFKTRLQFVIVINKPGFEKMRPEMKAQVVIHELWHIQPGEKDDDAYRVRQHGGDYCEIPEHDKFSRSVYEEIKAKLPMLTKLPFQTTLEEQTKRAES